MRKTAIAALVLFGTSTCLANDTMMVLGTGGLVLLKTTTVMMESEDLEISPTGIRVHYVFRNSSAKDVTATVGFPLPLLKGMDLMEEPMNLPSKDADNFVDFAVTADGKPVTTQLELRALLGRVDETAALKKYGLSASLLTGTDAIAKLTDAQKQALTKVGLLQSKDYPDPGSPAWNMQATYFWTQVFPAKSTVDVVHTYRPVVGGSFLPKSQNGDPSIKNFCGTAATAKAIAAQQASFAGGADDIAVYQREVQYVLKTANNWNGPIGKFHLIVKLDSADEVMSTCFVGLKQTSPTTFEATRMNFRPLKDLEVMVWQKAK
jgi:hypothetical protein